MALFTPSVGEFATKKAASIGSCPGYFVPCLLATTAYLTGGKSTIRCGQQEMPCNLFMVIIGPPGRGKSQALKEASLQPLHDLQDKKNLPNTIIEKCTSVALVKTVANNEKAFVVSPELFEVINKLLKSDEDNATGDAQSLCELFSGENSLYHYATKHTCEIPPNVPFSILGSTQVPYVACLLCRMDQGHGLLD